MLISKETRVQELYKQVRDILEPDAKHEARFILRHFDLDPEIDFSVLVDDKAVSAIMSAAHRRLGREPLSQILGTQPFWTLELKVTPDVLTPRSDTETLVEAVLKDTPDRQADLRILDIGTGSGAIVLALLSELPHARGIATDISPAALDVARENAERCGLTDRIEFIETRWADGVTGPFDIVVSNPPYIAPDVIETLEPEVRDHEPRLALDGGATGLEAYPHVFGASLTLLKPGGRVAVEIGYDQAEPVTDLARSKGLETITVKTDLAGHDRVIMASRPSSSG